MPAHNRHKTENRIALQLVSVFIAIVLWFIISYTENPVISITVNNIKVEYRGLDKLEERGLTIPDARKNPNLTMSVSGKRSDLLTVLQKARAYVDVSDIDTSDTYTLDVKTDMPTNAVTISKQKFKTLDVTVEPIVEKDVPVIVRQTDKNKEYLVKSTPQQNTVRFTGAESLLNNVSCVMVAVSTIDMKNDNMQKYNYRIMDSNNSEVDDKNSFRTDTSSILVYNELYTPKLMGVDINIPESVSSMYDVDILQVLTVMVGVKDGAPERLSAQFPENAITDVGSGDYTVNINSADKVYIESENITQKIRAVVAKKELQYVQIPVRFKNVAEGLKAWCETPVIDTYISCVPSKLKADSLVAYADMNGLGEGTHEITLEFEQTNSVKIIGEYKVKVTLSH